MKTREQKIIEKQDELIIRQKGYITRLKYYYQECYTKDATRETMKMSDSEIECLESELAALQSEPESKDDEIQHGIPFKCPECGKEIQYGLSEEGRKIIAKSRLFNKPESKGMTAEEILKNYLDLTIKEELPKKHRIIMFADEILECMEEYISQNQPVTADAVLKWRRYSNTGRCASIQFLDVKKTI